MQIWAGNVLCAGKDRFSGSLHRFSLPFFYILYWLVDLQGRGQTMHMYPGGTHGLEQCNFNTTGIQL